MGIHPAQFSKELLDPMAGEIRRVLPQFEDEPIVLLLDPCAGLGWRLDAIVKLVNQEEAGVEVIWYGIEIEPVYMYDAHKAVMVGDSTDMYGLCHPWWDESDSDIYFADSSWDIGVTSPTYGNGLNDNFHSKRYSKRNTYIHRIRDEVGEGYELHPNNTAKYSFRGGRKKWKKYLDLHARIYSEMRRVLKPGAPFIVNTKNFVSAGGVVNVTLAHDEILRGLGFERKRVKRVTVPGLRYGENHEDREVYESIVTYRNVK